MNISLFGLGYVGAVSAACLADRGHRVHGVDVVQSKVDLLNRGVSPVVEERIGELIEKAVAAGTLSATTDAGEAVSRSEMAWICVGTPTRFDGSLDTSSLARVCAEIGAALEDRDDHFTVVVRSTVWPGTTESVAVAALEESSGKKAGTDFSVCYHPEFMREGSGVADFGDPPKIVIGSEDEASRRLLLELYEGWSAPLILTDIRVSEMIKYADNSWHALKVAFANEIGAFCKAMDIDGRQLMESFRQDTKLNVSPTYLRPGFAFGGSCLPKELRAIAFKSGRLRLSLPLLGAVLPSNREHIDRAFRMVERAGGRRVGMLGLSFKAGTDDLRESPLVELAESLLEHGYDVHIYDRDVNEATLIGSNRAYLEAHLPHFTRLFKTDICQVLAQAETVIVGHSEPEYLDALGGLTHAPAIVDLSNVFRGRRSEGGYEGICW